MKEFGNIIPYDHAISGIANVFSGNMISYEIININYPEKWMEVYTDKKMVTIQRKKWKRSKKVLDMVFRANCLK
ncbi:hypothetical protein [Desulfobacterium sp. N47]|uniref:Uncharacterized protein n=1 Tax=uncultured Desulfobacterium sp. TaxID=201089 RepID=E1YDU5_9BACT|nr:unknown protein [uncultured Desulfobacterium sp.]